MSGGEGSFIRWQSIRIEQFGVVTNLMLGLATGVLALELPLVFAGELRRPEERVFLGVSMSLLFLSVVVALVLTWNRLHSFRLTAQVARKREQGDREGLDGMRARAEELDGRTWCLLQGQAWLFALGGLALIVAVFLRLWSDGQSSNGALGASCYHVPVSIVPGALLRPDLSGSCEPRACDVSTVLEARDATA